MDQLADLGGKLARETLTALADQPGFDAVIGDLDEELREELLEDLSSRFADILESEANL